GIRDFHVTGVQTCALPICSTGLPHDLRKAEPYCGYETYDFDVITRRDHDAYARTVIRLEEIWQSIRIVEQAIARLRASQGEPVKIGRASCRERVETQGVGG